MNSRERMRAALRRQVPDRLPLADSLWKGTLDRWVAAGHLQPDTDVAEFFGFDWRLVHFDSSFLFPEEVLAETPVHITRRNAYGTVARYRRHGEAPAEILSVPVQSRADWEKLRPRLRWDPRRFALTGFYSFASPWTPPDSDFARNLAGLRDLYATGSYVALYAYDAFESVWRRMGHEQALIALAEDPAWMSDMFEAQYDLLLDSIQALHAAGAPLDGLFLASDIAFKGGPLFSPAQHRELCVPGLRALCDLLHSLDMDLVFHCDGNLTALLPNLAEAGVDCLQPLEVQAGMDVRELKREWGDTFAFMGNIGVREMLLPEPELEALIAAKVRTASAGGGYVYHSDHSIPPDVPFERYQRVLELVRHYGQPY